MISLDDDRTSLIAVAIGIVVATVTLYLLLTRRTWFGQHLPLPLHPVRPRFGHRPENGTWAATAFVVTNRRTI